ncbi:MAG: hypothetical protein Q9174_002236 [Haloplaca sp. 1 TL-2023]
MIRRQYSVPSLDSSLPPDLTWNPGKQEKCNILVKALPASILGLLALILGIVCWHHRKLLKKERELCKNMRTAKGKAIIAREDAQAEVERLRVENQKMNTLTKKIDDMEENNQKVETLTTENEALRIGNQLLETLREENEQLQEDRLQVETLKEENGRLREDNQQIEALREENKMLLVAMTNFQREEEEG